MSLHNTTKSIKSFIDAVIEESIKSTLTNRALQEKELQDKTTDDLFAATDDKKEKSTTKDAQQPVDKTSSKTLDADKEKLKTSNIEPKDIIEKLNVIRAGRSFKDSAVAPALEQYIVSLSKAEKVALYAFLKGIAQITSGEVPAEDALEPSDKPADVLMKKKHQASTTKTLQPNIVRSKHSDSNKPSAEDTSAPISMPIVAKKKQ